MVVPWWNAVLPRYWDAVLHGNTTSQNRGSTASQYRGTGTRYYHGNTMNHCSTTKIIVVIPWIIVPRKFVVLRSHFTAVLKHGNTVVKFTRYYHGNMKVHFCKGTYTVSGPYNMDHILHLVCIEGVIFCVLCVLCMVSGSANAIKEVIIYQSILC